MPQCQALGRGMARQVHCMTWQPPRPCPGLPLPSSKLFPSTWPHSRSPLYWESERGGACILKTAPLALVFPGGPGWAQLTVLTYLPSLSQRSAVVIAQGGAPEQALQEASHRRCARQLTVDPECTAGHRRPLPTGNLRLMDNRSLCIEFRFCAKHWAWAFCVFCLIPTVTQGGKNHHPHFPDEKTEVSKGQGACPASCGQLGSPTMAPLSL